MALLAQLRFGLLFACISIPALAQQETGWPTYGGDPGGQRYSAARQITRANVQFLRRAWVYRTHALDSLRSGHRSAAFETTPVLFRGNLYLTTPFDEIIALNPTSGKQLWRYDPTLPPREEGNITTSRGVAAWEGSDSRLDCSARIFLGTLDARLIAVDATTGLPCQEFGMHGVVDLRKDVRYIAGHVYSVTSAPTVIGNVVVVGSSISDNQFVQAESGMVRGFDAQTGQQLWAWEPLPWAQTQFPRTGAGNAWSTIAADPKLGLLYVPTGSASPDYYGGLRPGDNRDADSVVALDAATGKERWAFQVVHHNLWDYDVAAEPLLFTWRGNVPAVAINTKMGQVFVLDRRTGVPLFPVKERPVPKSDVPDEHAWPTQPISSLPPLGPLSLTERPSGWQRSAKNAEWCDAQIKKLRNEGIYTPPSLRGSVEFPGPLGGVNWGSAAFDPASGVMYTNNNRYAYAVWLVPPNNPQAKADARWVLMLRSYFNWRWANRRLTQLAAAGIVLLVGCISRKRFYPGGLSLFVSFIFISMALLSTWRVRLLAQNVDDLETARLHAAFGDDHSPNSGAPYSLHREPLLDLDGLPCTNPPWGVLTALNLNSGKKLWESTEGTQVAGQHTGSVGLAGPMVTAGGLVFTAATKEPILRAFDATTGDEIWHTGLPAPAQATPMSYEMGGKQYVVIAAGGHGLFGTSQSDSVIAFSLP